MRGSLMRRWTPAQHVGILLKNDNNTDAAAAYTASVPGVKVSTQNVAYWRKIFVENDGNMAGADAALKEERRFIKPEPDDDIGKTDFIPDMARSILVIPDLHAPHHHRDSLGFLCAVRKAFQPDLVVCLGDELDYHALSFHDSDPNLDSAGVELEKAKKFMKELHTEFPEVLVCHSNHGSMQYRRAKAHGIPVQLIRKYRDVIFPKHGAKCWSWRFGWRVSTPLGEVMFKHQTTNVVNDAAHNQCSLVVGHNHSAFSVTYAASSAHLYWGMYCGCLVDKDSMAFAYGKNSMNKPILGCAVILEGRPMLIPMVLNADGRWIGRL